MEPNFIYQRLAKLDFFVWLNKKHSYFHLLEELEIYSHDLLDQDSIIRTSFNALALRFFKEQHGITAVAFPGKYVIEWIMPNRQITRHTKKDIIIIEGTNASIEEVSFELIKHVLTIIESRQTTNNHKRV